MSNDSKWNLVDLWCKIDYEGGLGSALGYFGREVNSVDPKINEAWRIAYDALEKLHDMIPEPTQEEMNATDEED